MQGHQRKRRKLKIRSDKGAFQTFTSLFLRCNSSNILMQDAFSLQYIAIPLVERGQRGSPSAPPSQSSTRRKTSPSQPDELPSLQDNVYGQMREEVGGSVVYAALNHQLPAAAAARPRRPREETSEYAAIRVKEPSPTRLNHFRDKDISR